MILSIVGKKGGPGKSTIATNLVTVDVSLESDSVILDSDPQGSANTWQAIRDKDPSLKRVPCFQKYGRSLLNDLVELDKKYKNVICDIGGNDSTELRAAMVVSDALLIPVLPSAFDIWALSDLDTIISEAKTNNPKLKCFIVMNKVDTNEKVKDVYIARDALSELENITVLDEMIHNRIAFRKAARQGKSVCELIPNDPKAKKEITDLHNKLFKEILNG